jgi:hypothetical protein
MTLGAFFQLLAENPLYIIFYFSIIPFAAWLASVMGKGEGHISPWKYLYSVLLYLVCIPGIFAVTLNVYLFLFEKRSIFDTDIFTQILPILSMVLTIFSVKRNVDLSIVPGFDRLSGLIMMISCTLILMWFVDRTHIVVFSYMRFEQVLIIFAVLLLVIRLAWAKFIR